MLKMPKDSFFWTPDIDNDKNAANIDDYNKGKRRRVRTERAPKRAVRINQKPFSSSIVR